MRGAQGGLGLPTHSPQFRQSQHRKGKGKSAGVYARYLLIVVFLTLSGGGIYKLTASKRANKLPGEDSIPRGGGSATRGRRTFESQQAAAGHIPSPIPTHHDNSIHADTHATDVHTEDHYAYHVDHDIHHAHEHDHIHDPGHYDHLDGHISHEEDLHQGIHYDAHHFDTHDHHDTEHEAPDWQHLHDDAGLHAGEDHHTMEHHDTDHLHQDIDHLHDAHDIHHGDIHHAYGDDKDHMDDHLGIYDMGFTGTSLDGHPISLDKYKGKVTLFVNVASQCGYTETNYRVLQAVYEKYKDSGLEILAFPCNDFGNQEPLHNWEIAEFARNHNVGFTMMAKISGVNSSPIFTWLRAHSPSPVGSAQPEGAEIDWNFNKFLVDKNGHVAMRYSSAIDHSVLEHDVYDLLVVPYKELKHVEHH